MVYLGVDDTNVLPDGIEVDPILHPKFNERRTGHDIMLLKANADYLLGYTHISQYLPWIRHTMMSFEVPKIHLMVYLGVDDTNLLSDGVEVDPIPHPELNMKTTGHDIMLLKLKTPATLNKTVSTITLPKTESEDILKDCMVMGWGWKKYHDESPSNVLKEANVTLIDFENCGTADTLCSEGSTGPAQGYAGGPLVCGGVAQGIMSLYKKKSNGDHITMYTGISHYLPWIRQNMSPEAPEILDPTPDAVHQNPNPTVMFCLEPKI
ncbi:Cationic trypsin [Labeo rohita]|uniref:Cationic trypsin n=1 Tax=Labeo rohita TaxID=84645 RepID=A0ABQ8LL77_LABRO|nr:Cationic trypsin [Labeo rohita]